MDRRSSSPGETWTPQQRVFIAIAVVLSVVALAICVVRIQSNPAPRGPGDGAAEVGLVAGSDV